MTRALYVTLLSLVILAPQAAFAAPGTFKELANLLVNWLNQIAIVLITLALVIYFWGIARNMNKFGDGAQAAATTLRYYVFWGVLILFVMMSVWGIIRLLQNTLFGGNPGNIPININFGAACASFEECFK